MKTLLFLLLIIIVFACKKLETANYVCTGEFIRAANGKITEKTPLYFYLPDEEEKKMITFQNSRNFEFKDIQQGIEVWNICTLTCVKTDSVK